MSTKLTDGGTIHAEDLYYLMDGADPIKILDATYGAVDGQSPYQAFLGQHIEGAQFFDIDTVADQDAPLPHTLPSADYFQSCVEAMGIENNDHVVIYDQSGAYMASSRAWWMFRVFGHKNVYVLEGGLQSWKNNGFPIKTGTPDAPEPSHYMPGYRPELLVTRNDLLENLKTKETLVIDARPSMRFHGKAQEPRSGMRAGHIPGSINLPFAALLDDTTRHLKDNETLQDMLDRLRIDPKDKVAVSCGSGVTACTVALALYKARGQEAAVYDGSWSEWGQETENLPIELSA